MKFLPWYLIKVILIFNVEIFHLFGFVYVLLEVYGSEYVFLQVFEFLALTGILTPELINKAPPCTGMERLEVI